MPITPPVIFVDASYLFAAQLNADMLALGAALDANGDSMAGNLDMNGFQVIDALLTGARVENVPVDPATAPGNAGRVFFNTVDLHLKYDNGVAIIDPAAVVATAALGGTGQTTYAVGDTLYASAAAALSKRAIGVTDDVATVVGGVPVWRAHTPARGHLYGLGLSNAAEAAHDITIAAGEAASVDAAIADRVLMVSAALTKQIDAAWAVGTAAGGMDTGAVGNNSWYHIFLIKRTDTGVVDALFSLSATAPTMPTDYTKKRRIGAVLTDGSANILAFVQVGDDFLWSDPPLDVNTTNPGAAAVEVAISVPPSMKALLNAFFWAPGQSILYISPTAVTDEAPALNAAPLGQAVTSSEDVAGLTQAVQVTTYASATSTIRYRVSFSDGGTIVRIATIGWTDTRGRF